MNKITWTGDRFEGNSPELEEAKLKALLNSHGRLCEFMEVCDLPMFDYSSNIGKDICIYRKTEQGELALFPITEEGTGFNVCFHLGSYAIASINLGQKLEICAYSFKPVLHPVLFQGLSKWFGDRRAEEIDKSCSYYSGDSSLKCAVNPSLPCKDCSDASAGFSENLFVWKATDLSDRGNIFGWIERMVREGRGANEIGQAFLSERPFRYPSEIRILRVTIGVDEGSGQDATAIASVTPLENGEVYINTLEIHADTSEVEAAIARTREIISRSTMLPEHLLYDGEDHATASTAFEIAARNYREAYRRELIDRITPLPPQIFEAANREYEEEARRRRRWAHFGGMQVYPQPHRMPIPQELYGILEDAEQNLPNQLGMTPEEIAEHKANGTLFAELHRRSQCEMLRQREMTARSDEDIQG